MSVVVMDLQHVVHMVLVVLSDWDWRVLMHCYFHLVTLSWNIQLHHCLHSSHQLPLHPSAVLSCSGIVHPQLFGDHCLNEHDYDSQTPRLTYVMAALLRVRIVPIIVNPIQFQIFYCHTYKWSIRYNLLEFLPTFQPCVGHAYQ
jgi:hypothetical protein